MLSEHGAIDVAVNAAATGQYSAFEQTTEAEVDEMLAIIFKGSFFFMQATAAEIAAAVQTAGAGGAKGA